jgi:hypothetical protein
MHTMNQFPTMIDSSSFSEIFGNMPQQMAMPVTPTHSHDQRKQKLLQMKSSPNLKVGSVSPIEEGSPSRKSPMLRKIASNRRLTVNSNETNFGTPVKSPKQKLKSPKQGTPTIALPSFMSSSSAAAAFPSPRLQSSGAPSSFEFVNYGIDDADELCSAVAPSGSYKIPLKGFGDDDEDEENEAEQGEEQKKMVRSRSKSNLRFGPRWQGKEDDGQQGQDATSQQQRLIKRCKSEANMMTLSGRKKTASSGNLRR